MKAILLWVCFVELKRPFESIDKQKLIATCNLLQKIDSYLSGRLKVAKISYFSSKRVKIKYGVPQGSILDPLLFLLGINDIQKNYKHCIWNNLFQIIRFKKILHYHKLYCWIFIFLTCSKINIKVINTMKNINEQNLLWPSFSRLHSKQCKHSHKNVVVVKFLRPPFPSLYLRHITIFFKNEILTPTNINN